MSRGARTLPPPAADCKPVREPRYPSGMTSAGFADVAVVTRTRRRLAKRLAQAMLAFGLAPILLTLIGVLVKSVDASLLWIVSEAAHWVWLSWPLGVPAASIAAIVAGTRRRMGGMTVDADGSGLVLESSSARIVAKRDAIESALVLEGGETGVELVLAGGDVVEVRLGDPASARAMVAALGLGAPDRRVTVPLGTARAPLSAGCAGLALAVCASLVFGWLADEARVGPWFALLLFFVAVTIVLSRLLTPGRVVVGTDGILVEKAFRRRWIPRASIVDLSEERDGLYAVVDLGLRARRILIAPGRSGARTAALAARIREVLAARGPSRLAASALLARGERSAAAWREGLRKLSGGARGYRDGAVSADVLLRVAEDPDAPAEQRIGAAMAIGFGDDAGAKQRLRVAAEGIADARLAAAMERAAEGEAEAEAIDGALAAARRSEVR